MTIFSGPIFTEPFAQPTRMHSSRMRTGRSLTVSRSLLPGGVCSWGMSAPGGVCLCSRRGWVSASVPRGSSYPPVLTSSGGQCSGRYASYWNAFLLDGWILRCFIQLPVKKLYSLSTLFFHFCPFCIIGSIVLCKVFLKGENMNRACYIFNIVTRVANYHG